MVCQCKSFLCSIIYYIRMHTLALNWQTITRYLMSGIVSTKIAWANEWYSLKTTFSSFRIAMFQKFLDHAF